MRYAGYALMPHATKKKVLVLKSRAIFCRLRDTKEYKKLYHVLTGVLSPLDGIGPKDIKIDGLMQRA